MSLAVLVSTSGSPDRPSKPGLACVSALSIGRHLQLLGHCHSHGWNQSAVPTVRPKSGLCLRFKLTTLFRS